MLDSGEGDSAAAEGAPHALAGLRAPAMTPRLAGGDFRLSHAATTIVEARFDGAPSSVVRRKAAPETRFVPLVDDFAQDVFDLDFGEREAGAFSALRWGAATATLPISSASRRLDAVMGRASRE